MNDLGIDIEAALGWFLHAQDAPYVLVRVDAEHASAWSEVLGVAVRRCYVSDDLVQARAAAHGVSEAEVIGAALPDRGSTMSGDFGEILVYFYQAAQELPQQAFGPRKWRLKQDRTKPAPHSDVVHFVLPHWPIPSADDRLLCSEVKTKATNGASAPISEAITDCIKDRTSRLSKTLAWLRERALLQDIQDVDLAKLNRFIDATDPPPATRHFRAVAVVCADLVNGQLDDAPEETPKDYTVVVISVPKLKSTYEAVYDAARQAVPTASDDSGGVA
ncbi:MAG TPA: DUF1837 domain-containing protein [Polyangiaceae bacterium]|nr:DUF1837 domain-containing protein [Polyangiaceae bacterium]